MLVFKIVESLKKGSHTKYAGLDFPSPFVALDFPSFVPFCVLRQFWNA